eukprot:CAMPEP_0194154808 /NCGR_PEP_ID=MMETSP0152-20130528/62000_1 /TAXON_ID=1049557 /ORGANISM="Thalassiothrix antarctica, Strain L6-D1" /LENGTH=205 /DNA_ID=CAMNT_0038861165 /DNA_START=247 /DNA_END=861 /DNA_ORIENTATION=+
MWNSKKISNNYEKIATLLYEGNYGDSDEDLFIALLNDKQKENTMNAKSASYTGAGVPRSSLDPEDIVPLLMTALEKNNFPESDAGLISMWEFASDTTKYIFQNNITEFIESCHETAEEFPTSFYGAAMNGQSWDMETNINRVGGKDGWIATQIMKTISSDGRLRRWQWELRKNKRPPCLGCWKVENIASSDRNGDFEATDRGTGW